MLSGNKDVDRKILNNLEDKDLVNVCQTNKKAQSLCNDQVFWMNRVFNRFGYVTGDTLRKNKKDRSWSEYYIKDLRKINKTNAHEYLVSESSDRRLDLAMIALKNTDLSPKNTIYTDLYLRRASLNGHLDLLKYLVSQGADINNMTLKAALIAGQENLEVIKYLVSQGIDIHADNDWSLKWAKMSHQIEVVKYLESLE